MKKIFGAVLVLGICGSVYAGSQEYIITLHNDTSCVWTDITAAPGKSASLTSMVKELRPNHSAQLVEKWDYSVLGGGNDNTSDLFFTCNGDKYTLHQQGYDQDGSIRMYLRFDDSDYNPEYTGLASGNLEINKASYVLNGQPTMSSVKNGMGYEIGFSNLKYTTNSAEVTIIDLLNKHTKATSAAKTCIDLQHKISVTGYQILEGECISGEWNGDKIYKKATLYTDECTPGSNIINDRGTLQCAQKVGPPGDYKKVAKFWQEPHSDRDWIYKFENDILSVDAYSEYYGKRVNLSINYKNCKPGSYVNTEIGPKLTCETNKPKVKIVGNYQNYCKGGYTIDDYDNITVKDCERDGLPKGDASINLSKCPDKKHPVVNISVEKDTSSSNLPWAGGITNPSIARKHQPRSRYMLKCVDLQAPILRGG